MSRDPIEPAPTPADAGRPHDDGGNDAPIAVELLGSKTTWTEAEWHRKAPAPPKHPKDCRCGCKRPGAIEESPRHISGRDTCPNGCKSRDLQREFERGLDRVCLRCFTHSADPEGWWIARPGTTPAPSNHKGRIKPESELDQSEVITLEEQAA